MQFHSEISSGFCNNVVRRVENVQRLQRCRRIAGYKCPPVGEPPPARYMHTAVWSPAADGMYVFGGYAGGLGRVLSSAVALHGSTELNPMVQRWKPFWWGLLTGHVNDLHFYGRQAENRIEFGGRSPKLVSWSAVGHFGLAADRHYHDHHHDHYHDHYHDRYAGVGCELGVSCHHECVGAQFFLRTLHYNGNFILVSFDSSKWYRGDLMKIKNCGEFSSLSEKHCTPQTLFSIYKPLKWEKKQKIAKSTNVPWVVQNLIWKDQLSRRFCCHFFGYFSGNMCCLRTKAFTVQDNHHSVLKFRNVAKFKKVAKGWPRSSTIPLMKRVVWAHKELTMFWQHANELDPHRIIWWYRQMGFSSSYVRFFLNQSFGNTCKFIWFSALDTTSSTDF